jgi:hypothetical protein
VHDNRALGYISVHHILNYIIYSKHYALDKIDGGLPFGRSLKSACRPIGILNRHLKVLGAHTLKNTEIIFGELLNTYSFMLGVEHRRGLSAAHHR